MFPQDILVKRSAPFFEDGPIGCDEYSRRHYQYLIIANNAGVVGKSGGIGNAQFPQQVSGILLAALAGEPADVDADQGDLVRVISVETLQIRHFSPAGGR